MTMLNINTHTVRFIIDQAKTLQTVLSGPTPDAPLKTVELLGPESVGGRAMDPAYAEAANAIEALDPEQQANLVALMWLGRGDFELEQWESALETAQAESNGRTADYLLETPLLASYLEEALDLYGIDADEEFG
ncbi:MAG: DUF3775 domain-containing protein [Pseudomonadales bacterium]